MALLSVNIDHIATVRQARYRGGVGGTADFGEPDAVRAAHEAELGGADGITVHLREDRRHIVDRDVRLLKELVRVRFNLEMGATDEMVKIACDLKPHTAMLVPEGRNEVTTEGGLDVVGQKKRLKDVVAKLRDHGIVASAFIDADEKQAVTAADCGFAICEIHTGPYAAAFHKHGGDLMQDGLFEELARIMTVANAVVGANMRCNAGHALNYVNVQEIAKIPLLGELHIGHSIVSRAVFTGLRAAVREMKDILARADSASMSGGHDCCDHDHD